MLTPLQAIALAIKTIETLTPFEYLRLDETNEALRQLKETQASLMPKPMRTAKPFDNIEISAVEWCGSSSGTAYQWVTVTLDGVLIGKAYISGHGEQYRMQAWYILRALGWYNEASGASAPSGFPIDYGNFLADIAEHSAKFYLNKWELRTERECKRWFANAGEVVKLPTNNESEVTK